MRIRLLLTPFYTNFSDTKTRVLKKQGSHDDPVVLTWGSWLKETQVQRSMCGALNTTVVNGYMNHDSHAVSWGILFFYVSKSRLYTGYFRDLYECKTWSQPFCCCCFILLLMGCSIRTLWCILEEVTQGSFQSRFIVFCVVVPEAN